MKLPLSVLMYRLTEDYGYGYETVNVDVSMEFEGIKLMDMADNEENDNGYSTNTMTGRDLYLIESEEFEKQYDVFLESERMSSHVFVCLCQNEKSAVCTSCRELSVVFIFAEVKFAYIFNLIQNIMKKFDEWEKSFHLSVLRSNSMQELLDITEGLMTHPLIVFDNSYSILGHTRDMSEVGMLMRIIISNGYASPDDMHNLTEAGVMPDFNSYETIKISSYKLDDESVHQQKLDRDQFYSIAYRFVIAGRTVGYALAFHCLSHPTNGYLYLMNMISEKLSLFFEQQHKNESAAHESYETFLSGILGNPAITERQINEQAGHIQGLHTEGRFILAQLQYNSIDDMSYSFINWSLRNSMPQFMPFIYRNSFYVLKNCKIPQCSANNKMTALSDEFLEENEKPLFFKCFRNINYECGTSSMFFSLKNLRTAAMQCREALSAGRSFLWNSPEIAALRNKGKNLDNTAGLTTSNGRFYKYDDAAFIHILSQLRRIMPPEALESPYFRILNEYDIHHGTDLCNVMAQYIVCGCSVTKTAAATYMHRNTILNKIKKAGSIMGSPLEDFTSQVFFMISYINSIA